MYFMGIVRATALSYSEETVLAKAADSDEFLNAHNTARAAVGVGPMTWDTTVAAYAQNYVQVLRDQHNCNLVHSGGKYGENLYWASGFRPTPTQAVQAWVDEKRYYHYDTNTCDPGRVCGHYTQVVWRNSVRLGCAILQCNDKVSYVISCNYDPPGNYVGQKPY